MTSSVTNLCLEFIEDVAGSTDERGDNFEAGRTNGKSRGEETEEKEEEVVEGQTHFGDGERRVVKWQVSRR